MEIIKSIRLLVVALSAFHKWAQTQAQLILWSLVAAVAVETADPLSGQVVVAAAQVGCFRVLPH
jgi:hypothetical protein